MHDSYRVLSAGLLAASLCAAGLTSAAPGRKHAQGRQGKPIPHPTMLRASSHGFLAPPPRTRRAVLYILQYDNDVPFNRDSAVGVPVGNRFDLGVVDPHTINQITFRLGGAFSGYIPSGVRASVWDINPTAMTNMQLAQFTVPAANNTTFGTVLWTAMLPVPIVAHNGPFVAAIFGSPSPFCSGMTTLGLSCDGVALSPGGTDPGMGFHAIRLSNANVTAQNLGDRNAIMRVLGPLDPVELMDLDVN